MSGTRLHKRFTATMGARPPPTVDAAAYAKPEDRRKGPQPAALKNKHRREELYQQQQQQKKTDKRERRRKRKRDVAELGAEEVAKRTRPQRTIENTREFDETVVDPDDEEIAQDQATDELASYFDGRTPKVFVTTSIKTVGPDTFRFAKLLCEIVPHAEFFPRRTFPLKKIIEQATKRDYTDMMVVNEDKKQPTALWVCHLPGGPTAHFKLTSLKFPKEIRGHGRDTGHYPEVIINNFHTRLGLQVGRSLTALFPQQPEFEGREVVTFHNQRDFIFFRRHRYIFQNKEKVGLQEIGPRFTLKLRTLQRGTFDSKFGEYEWVHKRGEMDTSRRRFFL